MKIVTVGLMAFALRLPVLACHAEASGESALRVALRHARTVIPDGQIQISPDTVARTLEASLADAAEEAGFSFGPDDEAVTCRGFLGCEGSGSFRGLVHVVGYHRPEQDSVIVTLRMLRFAADIESLYEQVDEVHLTRVGRSAPWRISKVVLISES